MFCWYFLFRKIAWSTQRYHQVFHDDNPQYEQQINKEKEKETERKLSNR
jgi:hypothetical protein